MQNETLKLVYPQWQGGDIAAFFKDLKPSEAARGYVFGRANFKFARFKFKRKFRQKHRRSAY